MRKGGVKMDSGGGAKVYQEKRLSVVGDKNFYFMLYLTHPVVLCALSKGQGLKYSNFCV